jgi:hypothetical protein
VHPFQNHNFYIEQCTQKQKGKRFEIWSLGEGSFKWRIVVMNWILISWYQVQSHEVESEMLCLHFKGPATLSKEIRQEK